MLIQPSDLFLKLQTEKNIGPSGKNPDNSSFDGTAPNKLRCFPPWTCPNLGRSLAFPEGTCLVDDAPSLKECPPQGLVDLMRLSPNWHQAATRSEPRRMRGSCTTRNLVAVFSIDPLCVQTPGFMLPLCCCLKSVKEPAGHWSQEGWSNVPKVTRLLEAAGFAPILYLQNECM